MELVLDVETTTFNKGNPYDSRNSLVSVHAHHEGTSKSYRPSEMESVAEVVRQATEVIFFNAKFDLTWLRRTGLRIDDVPLWDVQLAHFILRYQSVPFPSLDDVLTFYGLPLKFDKVKELWGKGVQTDQIDWDILCEYGEGDVEKTYQCYLRQKEEFKNSPQLYKVFKLTCKDTYVLQEMEWNGLKYNSEGCAKKSEELQGAIDQIIADLSAIYPGVHINFGSNDQLSAFLYGGVIKEEVRTHIGFYKTGQKVGQPRYSVGETEHSLPRLFEPLRGSEMAKENVFSTDESTLRKLKGKNKWIVDKLLELAKLDKLNNTYYKGLNKINSDMYWEKDTLHPQYNQCRVQTGRLSSSKPNSQNMSSDILDIFESRYDSTN